MQTKQKSGKRIDPDGVAVATLVVAGLSLVAQIELRLSAHRADVKAARYRVNRTSAAFAISDIRQALRGVDRFWRRYRRLGTSQSYPGPIRFGGQSKFYTVGELAEYADEFEILLDEIGQINRAVSVVMTSDLELSEYDRTRFVRRCASIRTQCDSLIFKGRESADTIDHVESLIRQARETVRQMAIATRNEPSSE